MISLQNHSKLSTSKLIGAFKEDIEVKSGFSGSFPTVTTPTLHVDVSVQRDNDLIAVDVQRFTEGRKNKFTKATEHKYIPPYFKEEYDFARDEVYMATIGMGNEAGANTNKHITQNALDGTRSNRKKIQRAIQKQQSDVLQTGIVTTKNGDSIDYRRKAESMVDVGGAQYWDQALSTPLVHLADGMKFLRDIGNSRGSTVNVIMRDEAMNNFLSNTSTKELADIRRVERVDIGMPQFSEASGMAFHGRVAAGDFVVNLWTYNEKYTDEAGDTQYYLDRENVIMLPNDFQGKTVFGGLPYMRPARVAGASTMIPGIKETDYLIRAYVDERTISSTIELSSAPLVVPFTIDKVYTIQVLAVV